MVRPRKGLIRWKAFENRLLGEFELRTARERLNYARKYSHCLIEADLSELQSMKIDKRHHVMKALSALAKFLGIYEEYRQLIKNYGLRWSVNSDDLIIRRLSKNTDRNKVFKWMDKVKKIEPRLRDFLDFMLVTGLRLKEAVESYNLIIRLAKEGKLGQYYNEESEILEHFKFKQIFIRRTKKAFISIVPKDLVLGISKNETLTYSFAISMRKKGLRRMFGDLREIHGTLLTKYLSPAEVDFLHGRVSGSVFMRNYFNPALISDLKSRVWKAFADLKFLGQPKNPPFCIERTCKLLLEQISRILNSMLVNLVTKERGEGRL